MVETVGDHNLNADDSKAQAFAQGEVIGGVRDPRTGIIVPVIWVTIFRDDEMGYTLDEAHTEDGTTVAVKTTVDPGRETRCWELIRQGYAEMAVPCGGSGAIHDWTYAGGEFGNHVVHEVQPGEQPHVLVERNAPFLFAAGKLGMTVISFCQGMPFGEVEEMERVVDAPLHEQVV